MSANNGVIRVGRKGIKKFAFGDGDPFDVDIVVAFQEWIETDEKFREDTDDRSIPLPLMAEYHRAAVEFVTKLSQGTVESVTTAEALDFLARLREQYSELAAFFRPKLREEEESPDTSEVELRFSTEAP